MKNRLFNLVSTILLMMGTMMLFACQAVSFPEEEYPEFSEHKLTVLTRSTNQEFTYPVQVYAFSEAGICVAAQKVASKDEKLSLKLPAGKCKVVAVSGSFCNGIPDKPTLQDVLSMPEGNFSTEPLSMGQADVVMGEKSQTLNLLMNHRVAKLSFQLKQVPDEVTDVQISVSKPYSRLSLEGKESAAQPAVVSCRREGADWVTGTVYLLPTELQTVTFSVSMTIGNAVQTYGYLHSGALESNTPYIIIGTYADGVAFSGSFIEQDWKDTEHCEFVFGPGAGEKEEPDAEDSSEEVVTVDELPESGTLWDGHVVADVEETSGGVNLLLFSLMEWSNLTSANYEADPDVAKRLALSYSEGQMKGWRIPTKTEAKALLERYSSGIDSLNAALERAEGTSVATVDSKLAAVRYLCEEGKYSFSFAPGTTIAKAGVKLQTYRLRLVRTVKVKLE